MKSLKALLALAYILIMCAACSPRPDVFYVISTNVLSSQDANGNEIYNSILAPQDTVYMYAEKDFVRTNYADGLRFYAPYYEQFTMNSIKAPQLVFDTAYFHAKQDLKKHFNEYMALENKGRPYVLMGCSQGGMIVLDLLKEMSAEQYKLCKGAYMLGYRLNAEDLKNPRIIPAVSKKKGKVVSFNSTMDKEASWDFVAKGAATCINPLNWKTDATPATLVFNGDTATVHVDPALNQLIVEGLNRDTYFFEPLAGFCPKGNLHHWDILFYKDAIRKRIRK